MVAKLGLTAAGPFSFLFVRFVIVAALFGLIVLWFRPAMPMRERLLPLALAGALMHGVYLGGVFYAISIGTPAGIAALVGAGQPVITCFLALGLLGERISRHQWLGVFLGVAGVLAVVWPRLGGEVPVAGLVSCSIAVFAISLGTIVQKRSSGSVDLLSVNTIQAVVAALFYALLLIVAEPFTLSWTPEVTLAMAWSTLAVSLGAVSILMVLVRRGQMASTSSLFFLAPPVAAVMGYFAFGEELGPLGIAGFAIASFGVWLVVRHQQVRH